MCCTKKVINQDKDETKFVQIILAIKTISPNIYRASSQLISVYLTVILFVPIVIHRGNYTDIPIIQMKRQRFNITAVIV